jgi:aryl-alcohol dehydrogenase-like predicted oxidoreductase
MLQQILGKSDLRVGIIGLGCVTFGREIDRRTSLEVLDRALHRGIHLLDTAAAYGDGASEAILGEWLRIRSCRNRVVLATKVSGQLTGEDIRRSTEESLRRLGTDHIDLLQSHNWDDRTPLEETLKAFDGVVRQGKVRYIGASNWNREQIALSVEMQADRGWAPWISLQPIYNLVDRSIEEDLLPFCLENKIGVMTYSPLGAGFLTGKYRREGQVPRGTRFDVIPGHQKIYFTGRGFRTVKELERISAESGYPMPELAIAWVFRRPHIQSVLIGARNPAQVDQAFEALELSRREEAQIWLEKLTSISAQLDD